MHLDLDTHFFHEHAHRGTQIMKRINRRNRKISTLHAGPVTRVTTLILGTCIPGTFFGIHVVGAAVQIIGVADIIKYKELRLRAKKRLIGNAGRLEVCLGTLRQ